MSSSKEKTYIYQDGGYEFLSLHRKVKAFNPKNTDNLIILDYFNTIKKNRDTSSVYHKLVSMELDKYRNPVLPSIPVSFQMIYHEINMAWIDIIHQMLFIDQAFETFAAQYGDIVKNIIKHRTLEDKESLVYRYYGNGETMFHVAGKLWMFNNFIDEEFDFQWGAASSAVYKDMKHVLHCYGELGKILFPEDKHEIAYAKDFNDVNIIDYLSEFAEELRENRFIK